MFHFLVQPRDSQLEPQSNSDCQSYNHSYISDAQRTVNNIGYIWDLSLRNREHTSAGPWTCWDMRVIACYCCKKRGQDEMKATVSLPVHPLIAVLQQQSLKSHRRKVKSKFTENPANLVVLNFEVRFWLLEAERSGWAWIVLEVVEPTDSWVVSDSVESCKMIIS